MKTRQLGTQGLSVSELGLGCMGLSDFYSSSGITEDQGISLIHRALALGVTFLDTADVYGPHTNERTVGKAIAGRRDSVVLATRNAEPSCTCTKVMSPVGSTVYSRPGRPSAAVSASTRTWPCRTPTMTSRALRAFAASSRPRRGRGCAHRVVNAG